MPVQVLGEGNFGKVWKAEVDDICGYEGTILVAVKGVKVSVSSLIATDLSFRPKVSALFEYSRQKSTIAIEN